MKKALLKALAELENEERANKSNSETPTFHNDRVFEKASASAVNFIATPSTTTTTSTTQATTSSEYPVIVQKSDSVQQHTIFSVEPSRDEKEQIQTSASSSFTSSKEFLLNGHNSVLSQKEVVGKGTSTEKAKVTPSTTTTTTTMAPPSSTEESEAKVEDVQFFSAPLVAAFTVHQDELGLPRSVVPIYKQNEQFHTQSTTIKSQQATTPPTENNLNFDYLRYQEQQKVLTEQISKLQKQQELYKEYLSKQQGFYHNLQVPLATPVPERVVPLQNQQFFTGNVNGNSLSTQQTVVVQPSYSLTPHHVAITTTAFPPSFPPNGQQLPIKNPVDFNKNDYFLPLRYNTLLQPPAAEVHPVHVNPLPSRTRIFRQELHTGNFLNTPISHQPFQPYQPFRGNFRNTVSTPFALQPPLVNQRLTDLLYRSGIGIGKQQEDLNIVSKVLALNRLRRQSYDNLEA